MTFVVPPHAEADLHAVKQRLALADDDIDPGFGVIEVDPARRIFTALVTATTARRLSSEGLVEGSFANPPIDPLGPSDG